MKTKKSRATTQALEYKPMKRRRLEQDERRQKKQLDKGVMCGTGR
jgi:hypothetical protein